MSSLLHSRSALLSQRPLLAAFRAPPSQYRPGHVSVNVSGRALYTTILKPTPSQLLRFALTGTTKSANDHHHPSSTELDQNLSEVLLGDWPRNSPRPPLMRISQPQTERRGPYVGIYVAMTERRYLGDLQVVIEKYVNNEKDSLLFQTEEGLTFLERSLRHIRRRTSYGEVVSALNAIITRLEGLSGLCSERFYVLGMYYAALALSAPALERFMKGYLVVRSEPAYLSMRDSILLVNALLDSLHSLKFREPTPDTSAILNLVTGTNKSTDRNLQNILFRTAQHPTLFTAKYICLLVRLQGGTIADKIWHCSIRRLKPNSPDSWFQHAYVCVAALVDTGDVPRAIRYLKQVSRRANGRLPGISEFGDLSCLLTSDAISARLRQLAGEEEYPKVLEVQMSQMEDRLGIRWHPEKSRHMSASGPPLVASGKPLLTIDDDPTGYGNVRCLLAELKALRCSRSMADLGRVATLLDEHEGKIFPVMVPKQRSNMKFALSYRRCPVQFTNVDLPVTTDASKPWTPSNLGLLRIAFDNTKAPLPGERSMHVMPLGVLSWRPASNESRWKETGHIVAWDRVYDLLVAIFVGNIYKSHNTNEQTINPPSQERNYGLEALATVSLPSDGDRKLPSYSKPRLATRYHLEVDPSPDLIP
ncbi:hypothetical protein BO70DRAFT_332979 [Aspergillus heteromorphus CBS 117.55]|uniref:Uncharacterized protein n=1 Tax=Aspergillus heteromorphus CBS 117.55 TaxID=1448321 RepID=A0A317WMM9_9EURO|nr:uncharacterized protein BO70DRAFT_332979 [Aspergillus heteromorphus CBS 117.55]PWY87766.1 hypothetical protein BO70DRAFT_332979 [Aspergillus heteromorphus CBS 117.55]